MRKQELAHAMAVAGAGIVIVGNLLQTPGYGKTPCEIAQAIRKG